MIDQLLANQGNGPLQLAGENGLLNQLTKALVEAVHATEIRRG